MAGSFGRIGLGAVVAAFAIASSGCAPAASFAGLSNERMIDLFPTADEIEQVYGPGAHVGRPVVAPPAIGTASPAPTLAPGLPEECRSAYLGNDESRSIVITRGLRMIGDAPDPTRVLFWTLAQISSADEAKRSVAITRSAYAPCPVAKSFDLGTENGFGATIPLADGHIFSVGLLAVGDITMTVSIRAGEEHQDKVRRMSAIVERHLKNASK